MKKINSWWGTVFLFSVCVILFAVAWFFGNYSVDSEDYVSLQDGWFLQINEKEYGQVDLEAVSFPTTNRGDLVTIARVLPDVQVDSAGLELYTVRSAVEVYLDDTLIYSNGMEQYRENKLVGYGVQLITLPEEYVGRQLSISFYVAENDAFSSIDVPRICNGKWYLRDYLYENRVLLLVNTFLALFGICVGTAAGIGMLLDKSTAKLFCASMFSLTIGLWSLANYDLLVLFTENLQYKIIVEYCALYFAPLFIFLYFREDAMLEGCSKYRRNSYRVILFAQGLFCAVAMIGQLLNLIHLPQLLHFQHVLLVAITAWLIVMFFLDMVHKRMQDFTLVFGATIMVFFAMFDLADYYVQKYFAIFSGRFHGFICIGTMVFTMALLIHYLQQIMQILYQSVEQKTLEKLAYTDALTGLSNRHKCEEVFDELDETEQNYALIVFDLNHLKKVNDTLGHEMGDQFIAAFGQCLSKTFGQYGLVGRTGGDEFLVIIKNAEGMDLFALIEFLQREIALENEKYPAWDMSTAYGISLYSVDGIKPVRSAYKVADARMYAKKMEMKGEGAGKR